MDKNYGWIVIGKGATILYLILTLGIVFVGLITGIPSLNSDGAPPVVIPLWQMALWIAMPIAIAILGMMIHDETP